MVVKESLTRPDHGSSLTLGVTTEVNFDAASPIGRRRACGDPSLDAVVALAISQQRELHTS